MTLVWGVALAQEPRVWVVTAEEGGVHAEAVAVLRGELDVAITAHVDPEMLASGAAGPPELIVTVGTAAFERSLAWLRGKSSEWAGVPVLASLLPRAAYEARAAEAGRLRPVSGVVLDQPLSRQMALIRRALPGYGRVGVLVGPQTQALLEALGREARASQLQLAPSPLVRDADALFPALREVANNADVLLALPEPLIYQAANLQNILLATYRARVPVVAFSPAYVKAGALLAVYATPAQVARETGTVARQWLAGRGMAPVRAPREFAVSANPRVAASLGIALDDADRIAEDLRRAEGGR